MTRHVDFTEQAVRSTESGTQRPDMVINLPGAHRLLVDDDRLLPAGATLAESTADVDDVTHLGGQLLGERDLDLAYTAMAADADGRWRAHVTDPSTG